ncbi:MAG TPA: ABC transporter permease subunit [Nitriliruptorales bacterium]
MTRLRRAFANPVLQRELLERWRGRRAFVVITIYVGLLAGIMRLLWWMGNSVLEQSMRFGGFDQIAAGPALGRFMFENLLAFVLLLVLFVAPGYAAAQISGERERKTLGLLQITLVRPWQIVAGKLGSSIAWLLLLVVTSLPFAATAFLLGGVTLPDMIRGYAMVLLLAIAIAGIAIGISSLTRRTTAAVVMTYGVVLALVIGTLLGAAVEAVFRRFDVGPGNPPLALYANPYYGLADAARADQFRFFGGGELPSVLTPFATVLPGRDLVFAEPGIVVVEDGFGGEAVRQVPDFGGGAPGEQRQPVWLITLGLHLVLGAVGFAFATSRVRPENTPLLVRRARRKDEDVRGRTPADPADPAADADHAEPDDTLTRQT